MHEEEYKVTVQWLLNNDQNHPKYNLYLKREEYLRKKEADLRYFCYSLNKKIILVLLRA